ncbi:MAG: 50S ribosomal protein L28 [Pirellulales bacterium]|nr:50S ribosomal protein L28 [Pirellulales bacterium]
MAQVCEVCGKKPNMGNTVTTRGRAKYLGGVGTKVTGISRRKFRPNLQNVHVTTSNGTNKSMRVCTQCIRSGAVTKTIRSAPFKLPPSEATAHKAEPAAAAPAPPKPESVKSRKRRKAKEEKAAREKK